MECQRSGCNGETTVITTIASHDKIERTRRCKRCGHRFTTTEVCNVAIIQALERMSAEQGRKAG
jgi:transcriptional regulator NrdR family protein